MPPDAPTATRRADARQNRERLLDATIDLILEAGGEPSRQSIATRAGLGIGTLYRHFPDRQSLLHAAARRALERTIDAGEAILAERSNRVDVLRRYLHAAIDNGIGAVNIIHPLLDQPEWPDLRARAERLMQHLVRRSTRDGRLRPDFSERDIVFASIRFGRPLAIGLTLAEERAIAHRQLDIYVDGLHAQRAPAPRRRPAP